jgi:hypothetical protein
MQKDNLHHDLDFLNNNANIRLPRAQVEPAYNNSDIKTLGKQKDNLR